MLIIEGVAGYMSKENKRELTTTERVERAFGYSMSMEENWQLEEKAMNQAIEALEKQEPMKLFKDYETGWQYPCGSCAEELREWMCYCPYCGQAIDWEVTE